MKTKTCDKTYAVVLTPAQLRTAMAALMCYEQELLWHEAMGTDPEYYDTFFKVHDATEQYYNDNGIVD